MSDFIVYDTVDLPQWAMVYIEYGDCSGIDQLDIDDCDNFIQTLPLGFICAYGFIDEFNTSPAFGLPCGTVSTDIMVQPQ